MNTPPIFRHLTFLLLWLMLTASPVLPFKVKKIPKKDRIDAAMQQEYMATHDPISKKVTRSKLLKANSLLQGFAQNRLSASLIWTERGPSNVGGRTRAIMFDQSDATNNTVFAAGISGGLWKTTQISSTNPNWQVVNDFFGSLAISSIAQHPSQHTTMYFGTGEGYFDSDAVPGMGLWKSSNGGSSWTHLASTNNPDFQYVQRVVVAPNGYVFAATFDGIKRSTNGGISWTTVLDAGGLASSDKVCDIEIASNGYMYASMGIHESDGIYRSTNGGISWTKLTSGLPSSGYYRIELAVAPSDANRIYALYEDSNDSSCKGIYKSTNGGSTWVTVTNPPALGMANFARTQAWYDFTIAVDPMDEDRLFIGGIDLLVSDDAGSSWDQISQWSGVGGIQYVHADQHCIVFAPGDSDKILFGNDGGVWMTTNGSTLDPTIFSKNNGFNVTQFYGCAMHPTASSNYFLAGAQDNGTQMFNNAGMNATTEVAGGDGARCYIDPNNPNIQIASYVFNNFFVSTNGGNSFNYIGLNNDGLFANPSDYDPVQQNLYSGSVPGKVLRWNNPATGGSSHANVTLSGLGSQQVTYIKVSPSISNRIYVGTDEGDVYYVNNINSGSTRSAIKIRNASSGYVSSIDIDEANENHILVAYSNYNLTSVYESTNGGSNWTSIEGNLPDMPVRHAIFHPNDSDKAILGTELGVWVTSNISGSGTNWIPENTGLANVRVDMIGHRPSDNMLLAASHGRGLYSSSSLGGSEVNFDQISITASEDPSQSPTGSCQEDYKNYTIPVSLTSAPSSNAVVNIVVNNGQTSATVNRDYNLSTTSLTFTPSGPLTKNVIVKIIDDAIEESSEILVIYLQSNDVSIGQDSEATLTIVDNDHDPFSGSGGDVEIGNGSSSYDKYPFRGYYEDERTQVLYRASELLAAGLSAGNIESLALHVKTKGSDAPFNGFNVKIQHTTLSTVNLSGDPFETGGQTVYSGNLSTSVGWNSIQFSTPFNWNGIDNILIEYCFNNNDWSDDDEMYTTTTSYQSVQYRHADGNIGCNLSTVQTTSNKRLDVKFSQGSTSLQLATTISDKKSYVGGFQTANYYDNGKLVLQVKNLSANSIACTTVDLDRSGNGKLSPSWLQGYSVSKKTFYVDADNNANYEITLFFTSAELSGWGNPNTLGILKTNSPIPTYNGNGFEVLENENITITDLPGGIKAYTGQFSSFSGFGLTDFPQSTVPVELVGFDVRGQDQYNQLIWETENEVGIESYDIERSFEGQVFAEIGTEDAENRSEYSYSFKDWDLLFKNRRYYYRLRIVGVDGSFQYSDIKSIYVSGEGDLTAYPNPFRNRVLLELSDDTDAITAVVITSEVGAILFQKNLPNTASTKGIEIDLSEFPAGMYVVKYITLSGQSGTRKLFKTD